MCPKTGISISNRSSEIRYFFFLFDPFLFSNIIGAGEVKSLVISVSRFRSLDRCAKIKKLTTKKRRKKNNRKIRKKSKSDDFAPIWAIRFVCRRRQFYFLTQKCKRENKTQNNFQLNETINQFELCSTVSSVYDVYTYTIYFNRIEACVYANRIGGKKKNKTKTFIKQSLQYNEHNLFRNCV